MNLSKNKSCPICLVDLDQEQRQGIRVGICPQCRSFWLERGEMERALQEEPLLSARTDRREEAPSRALPR